jgi:hypothetical protein
VELKAEEIEVLGWADPEQYPLQKKRHSFEFLRTSAHLRPRTNTFGAVARVRNALSFAIHTFFQERGFVYVHTPIITGSGNYVPSYSGHGLMHAPATGRAIAELILDGGYQTIDLSRLGYQRVPNMEPVAEEGIV